MTTGLDVVTAMVNATTSKSGCQKVVRSFIDGFRAGAPSFSDLDIADAVAAIVGDYKKAAVHLEQKVVNNVINDVSRICREKLGYSIVCTSRKDSIYKPILPQPRKKSVTAAPIPDEWKGAYVNEIHSTVGASVALDWLKNSLPDSEIPAFTKLYTEYVKEKFSKESV